MGNSLFEALKPVRKRIRRNRMIRGAAWGLAAGAAGALCVLLLSRVVMIPDVRKWAGLYWIGAVIFCTTGNGLRQVSSREAAEQADRCGLMERAVTALETAEAAEAGHGAGSAMRDLQTQDACEALKQLDVKKIRAGSVRRALLAAGIGCVLCAVALLIPNSMDQRAGKIKDLRQQLSRISAEADKAAREDEGRLTDAEKSELRKLTEDLKRELERSRDEADALVAIDRAEKRIEEMRSRTAGEAREAMEAMQALAEALSAAGLEEMAQGIEAGDEEALAQALAGMTAEQAEALSRAAEGLEGQAKEAGEAMAGAAQSGDAQQAASDAMQALQGGGQMSASALQQALQGMKAALSGNSGNSGNQGSSGNAGQAGQNGSGNRNGGGAGRGTTNEEQQGGGGTHQASAARGGEDPEYREGRYETIYDPEKVDIDQRDEMTEQRRLDGDSVQIQAGEGKGTLDGSVPYDRVIGEYSRAETRSADSENLTGEQRDWVREYFRLLTEQSE